MANNVARKLSRNRMPNHYTHRAIDAKARRFKLDGVAGSIYPDVLWP